jgi:chromosome segregation ATPase
LGKLAAEAEEARSQAELREVALQEELAAQNLKVDQLRAELGKLAAEAEEARSQAELREVALQEKFTEQTINTAELSGRLALAESMLSQRQEELSQVWSDLLNKEAQLSANAATRGFEQERQAELERCLAETKVELANEQSALAELRQETAAKLASRFSEIAELTQALMRAEVVASEGRAELVAKDAALQSATADLMTHISQNNELLGQLSHAQDELAKSKQVHATAEQQIKMRHNEIAQLTKILAEQSAGLNNSAANNVWLREMMMVMARMPRWWALLPSNWRRKREHALYRRAGLFDVNEYLSTYPDVAEDGMDPVRHYILHGIEEARRRPA